MYEVIDDADRFVQRINERGTWPADGRDAVDLILGLKARIATLEAELKDERKEHQEALDLADRFLRRALAAEKAGDEAKLVAVRAAKSGVRINGNGIAWREWDSGDKHGRWEKHDGTDSGIYAALRRAMGESE